MKPRLQVQTMKTSDLIPYVRNAKQHPEEQVAQIAAGIREFGMNDPVAVWHDKDGTPVIVEGHGRVLALQKLNIEECPVICLDDLTDSQRRAYTLIHNQLTMNTEWDADILSQTSNPAMKHALLHYDDWKLTRNNINLFNRKYAVEHARKHKHDFSKTSRRVKTASFVIRKHR